jgi:hypothetical protein
MKCEQARLMIGADPDGSAPELEAHVAGCADCGGYRREMQRLEGDLRRAMAWPAAAAATPGANNVVPLHPAPRARDTGAGEAGDSGGRADAHSAPLPTARRWAVAASVLLVGVLAASFFALQPPVALASDIVEHMAEEPEAWRQDQPVPQSALDLVLRRAGVRLDRVAAGEIVYAHSCFLRGRQVPHLVITTPTGPLTVLVLRGEKVPRRVAFDEGGYSGVLLPVPGGGGGIAVLARDGAAGSAAPDVEGAAARVRVALQFDGDASRSGL